MRSSLSKASKKIDWPNWLTAKPYAHRGLHGTDRIENSRAAFEAAIAAGFNIELDVQASRDNVAMVFHDYKLDRLTEASGPAANKNAAELARIKLDGQEETIPTLTEILRLVAGRVTLLIEIKAHGWKVTHLCWSVCQSLQAYRGSAAIMSFNPEISAWFATNAPHIARGLVISEEEKSGLRNMLEHRLSLWRAKPDFLAYDIHSLPSCFAAKMRIQGLPILTWTIRNRRDMEIASIYADQIIHELS